MLTMHVDNFVDSFGSIQNLWAILLNQLRIKDCIDVEYELKH